MTDSTDEAPASDTSGAADPASPTSQPPASTEQQPQVHSISGSRYLLYNSGRKAGQSEAIAECATNVRAAGLHYKERIANARKMLEEGELKDGIDWEELAVALADNYGKLADQFEPTAADARRKSMHLLGKGLELMQAEQTPAKRPMWIVRVMRAFRAALRAA